MTPTVAPDCDAGFTLIEVVVALALFALIAAAGAALVTTVLDAQRHTSGRLDRLADLQRAMAVVDRDVTEIADGPLTGSIGVVAFERHRGSWDAGGGVLGLSYRLVNGRFERVVDGQPQLLLDHVTAARWQYYTTLGGWQDHWPIDVAQARVWPAAVAIDLDISGPPPNGHLRRIVDLPVRPLPPGTAVLVVPTLTPTPAAAAVGQ